MMCETGYHLYAAWLACCQNLNGENRGDVRRRLIAEERKTEAYQDKLESWRQHLGECRNCRSLFGLAELQV